MDGSFDMIQSFILTRETKVFLNGNSSRCFCINKNVPQGIILRLTLFVNLINDIHNDISDQVSILMTELFVSVLMVNLVLKGQIGIKSVK